MDQDDLTVSLFLISLLSVLISGIIYFDTFEVVRRYNISLDSFLPGKIWYTTGFIGLVFLAILTLVIGIDLIRKEKSN